MNKNSQKGFTLVELSIVLVIIGLLIGGILAAQSMIGTAKVQNLTRVIGQYDATVANFQTKFNSLPGDSTAFGGDGNGQITDTNNAATIVNFTGEIANFWPNLSASGLKPTGVASQYTAPTAATAYSAATLTANAAAQYIPSVPLGTNAGVMAYYDAGVPNPGNYYKIANLAVSNAGVITALPTSGLKAADAAAIDAKIDDGIPNTGNVLGGDGVGLANANTPGAGAGHCESAAGTWNTSQTTGQCNLTVRMGISTGINN